MNMSSLMALVSKILFMVSLDFDKHKLHLVHVSDSRLDSYLSPLLFFLVVNDDI